MEDKKKTSLDRFDITNDINNYTYLQDIQDIISQNHYHIRIENERDKNMDIVYMKEFTDILYNL